LILLIDSRGLERMFCIKRVRDAELEALDKRRAWFVGRVKIGINYEEIIGGSGNNLSW